MLGPVEKCLICSEEFEMDDDIVETDHGLLHAEDCFVEYCWEQYGHIPRTYREFEQEFEENMKLYYSRPFRIYQVKIRDSKFNVLAKDKHEAINLAIKRANLSDDDPAFYDGSINVIEPAIFY